MSFLYTKGIGYATEMALRPQTLYGLAVSPIAVAAWMLGHDAQSYDDIAQAFAGNPVGNLTRDEVLDNIMLTWVTNTGISSGRLHWENKLGFFDIKGATVPAAVTVFPREFGKSQSSSRPSCGRRSGRCADSATMRAPEDDDHSATTSCRRSVSLEVISPSVCTLTHTSPGPDGLPT